MNLIDAIKSGRPFRRKNDRGDHLYWWTASPHHGWRSSETASFSGPDLLVSDLIADDWEVQEPSVTITAAQLKAAIGEVMLREKLGPPYRDCSPSPRHSVTEGLRWDWFANWVCQEIGLK